MYTRHPIVFLITAGLILHLSLVSATVLDDSETMQRGRCQFPRNLIAKPGEFHPFVRSEDGILVQEISVAEIIEWRRCIGKVDKAFAKKMLLRLKRNFKELDGSEEIMEMTTCRSGQILKLFNINATPGQAKKAGRCLGEVFSEQDRDKDDNKSVKAIVRIDEDCELDKQNQILAAEARVAARLVASAAAGVCCATTTLGVGIAWCSVFAALAAATLEAEAELFAALNIRCPECSDAPVSRYLGALGTGMDYRKRFISQNHFYAQAPVLDAPQL